MKRFLMLLTALFVSATVALAVPSHMNYQGQLFLNGSPASGPVSITFRLYDAAVGGNLLWTETDNVTVNQGLFSTILGDNTPIPYLPFSGQTLWLEMEINGTPLSPRTQFVSVPYAYRSQRADTSDVALSGTTGNELWSTDGTNVWRPSGGVGINTVPQVPLHLLFRSPIDANTAARFEFAGAGASDFELIRASSENGQTPRTFRIRGGNDYDTFTSFEIGTATDHPLRFVTNSAERMRITKDGNVGIGTMAPAARLHLSNTIPIDYGTTAQFDFLGAGGSYVDFIHNSTQNGQTLRKFRITSGNDFASNPSFSLGMATNHDLGLNTNDTERMRITKDGNVGIGTPTPITTLDVIGGLHVTNEVGIGAIPIGGIPLRVAGFVRVDGGPAGSIRMMSNGSFGVIETIDNTPVTIQPSGGNVGIGTTNPTSKLHVAGDISATGTIYGNFSGTISNADLLDGIDGSQFLRNDWPSAMSVNTPGGTNALSVTNNGTGSAIFAETKSNRTVYGAVNGKASVSGGSGIVGEVSSPGLPDDPGTPGNEAGSSVAVYAHSHYAGTSVAGAEFGLLARLESKQEDGCECSLPGAVMGQSLATSGRNAGVIGEVHSPDGFGVISYGKLRVHGDLEMKPSGQFPQPGNIFLSGGGGIILKATNGPKCFRITVDNNGNLDRTEVPCP